jgi:serine/threonine protein kinase
MQNICKGLADMHQVGAVHRDLKPEKIMVDKLTVKIADLIAI